eukprot:9990671-Karenia_brevis.AAC.1
MLEKEAHQLLCNTIETATLLLEQAETEWCLDTHWLATAPYLQELVSDMIAIVSDVQPSYRQDAFASCMDGIANMLGCHLDD